MRKVLARTAAWLLSAALLAGTPCLSGNVSQAAKVRLNKSSLKLKEGETFRLKVKNYKKKVKWATSDNKVAKVSSKGVVKARSHGNAVITAKAGKKKLKCKVKVKEGNNADKSGSPSQAGGPAQGAGTDLLPAPAGTQVPTPPANAPDITEGPAATAEPTGEPEPTATPVYMQEGAFVYDKLDISWIDPQKPMVAFTFDDGPVGSADTDFSMRIQKALNEYGFHATFNYVTSKLGTDNMNNEVLMAMEAGHEIANHTSQWDSLNNTSKFPDGNAVAGEIENARKALSDLTGISDFTLRPPNLDTSDLVFANCNVPLIGSSIISNDWEDSVTKEHVVEVTKGAGDGDIVLLHETMQHTAEAVEELVPWFAEQGCQIVSVSELFAAKDIPLFAGNYYNKAEYQPPRS